MAAPLLRTVRLLPGFRLEMRMPRITTEILPRGLISAKPSITFRDWELFCVELC